MADTPDEPPEKIGYKQPPRRHQFQKGQPSANPKGRPRKDKAFQELLREQLGRKVTISVGGRRRKVALNEVVLQQLLKKAAEGDLAAMREVVKLNLAISPLRPEPTIPTAELLERQEMAAKLSKMLLANLEAQAAAKKRAGPRWLPPKPKAEPEG